jgi:rsbT co-antagonist protein RsbR
MSDRIEPVEEAKRLREAFRISDEDLDRIRGFGKVVGKKEQIAQMIDRFYEWLKSLPEFDEFFSDPEVLKRTIKLQQDYWVEFFRCELTDEYIQRRQIVGEVHARIGLPVGIYIRAMNTTLDVLTGQIYEGGLTDQEYAAAIHSVSKLMNLDLCVVVETYSKKVTEKIEAQSRSLMELSTPVTQIWDGVLLLPLVGIIDTRRAQDVMQTTLSKIAQTQARTFILDISGVGVVDTAVANHLIQITKATRLMGCECSISGVSPAVAQTIVELGIDIGTVETTGTMQEALARSLRKLGQTITEVRSSNVG